MALSELLMFWIGLLLGLWFGMSIGFVLALFLRNLPDKDNR